MNTRCVVTGVDHRGVAVVIRDAPAAEVRTVPGIDGWEIATLWTTSSAPTIPLRTDEEGLPGGELPDYGTRLLVWQLPPLSNGANPAGMHSTDSIDYVVVLSGSVDLVMDGGQEVTLRAGNSVVQNGARHEWINRGATPCVMAVVMVRAQRVDG